MMEDSAEESLDGSSIKPVSSLRSHFEQMANSTIGGAGQSVLLPNATGTRGRDVSFSTHESGADRQDVTNIREGIRSGRSMERQEINIESRPSRTVDTSVSLPPTTPLLRKPHFTLLPEVTIEPPQSPPRSRTLSMMLPSTPAYLSTASPSHHSPISTSPRHFRIPSRPQTPLLEPGKSPRLPVSQPPSPPPPRRSGELRRETSFKSSPPPVNRAEKPKIPSKSMTLGLRTEATTLVPRSSQSYVERTSPFSTPPSSGSSPEQELPPSSVSHSRPWKASRPYVAVPAPHDPLPTDTFVTSKTEEQEGSITRLHTIAQIPGDQKPALPRRPHQAQDPSSSRSMLPPPRPPSVNPYSGTIHVDGSGASATPPKRVFSTPSTQLHTPPRSHARSMTVDRTSDKVPVEFRTSPALIAPAYHVRQSFDASPMAPKEALQLSPGEYPDTSGSNRRPPYSKEGAREISTKYETRIMDVCGQFVCTSGLITRIWSLKDGAIIANLAHTEGIRVTSVAFKSGSELDLEGSRVWLGNNIGELVEIDVGSQSIVASKAGAHTRREIIRMYRHACDMWTLDDGGTLHLWSSLRNGSPTLSSPSQTFRLPKGHTFSMVVGHELWYATGKDLRVFAPTVDGSTQFQILQRPLYQENAGDITSGAMLDSQSDRVYFGHTDGKISIYSRRDHSCLGVVSISVYKVTSLAGVGGHLWASFSTGMIYIYDTSRTPWAVVKDWRAHHDPIIKLLVDPSSCWLLDRSQVISLGQDNMLRVWDGLLQDDWIETRMRSQESRFCEFETIKALVMTWNAGASTPYHLQHSAKDAAFFQNLLRHSGCPDILVFGFQELVDLEDKKAATKSFFKSKKKDSAEPEHMSHQYRDWRDFLTRCLDDYMPRDQLYHLLHTSSLIGLFTCIFVRAPLRDRIRSVSSADVKRGMGGLHGNKGALIVRFVLDDTSLCFINCHLAAGQSQTKDRNVDISLILESAVLSAEREDRIRQDCYTGGGDGTMIMDHELCVLNGDLNYRIDTMGRDTVVSAVKANNLAKLLERDQLLASRRKNPWFKLRAFQELPITFAPTYKYDVGSDDYDSSEKKRAPAWCDRLLYRGGRDRIRQLDYQRHEVRVSDHRPVTGSFDMVIKRILASQRGLVWDQCREEQRARTQRLTDEAKHEYLTSVLGFDAATSRKLIRDGQGD